eukprot:scaffold46927_cov56-Cyclotella_meneghiniana.AAC.3
MFGFQAFIPSRANQDLSSKKRSLTNYFFALIRVRDPHNLIYWAMIGTMAMFNNGASIQYFKNPLIGSFSAGKKSTFNHLKRLHAETSHIRRYLIESQAVCGSSLDNYNCDHRMDAFQHGSAYHKGIVFNIIRGRAFPVPTGTTVIDRYTGVEWTVVSSRMIDTWTCECSLMIFHPPLMHPFRRRINLPSVHWKFGTVPCDPMPSVEITYIDQHIPESMRQKVPQGSTIKGLVLGCREWMEDHETTRPMRPYTPREHVSAMESVHLLEQVFFYNRWSAGDEFVRTDKHPHVIAAFVKINALLAANPQLETNVRNYQVDSLKYWNVTHNHVDKMMLLPICPRDEMKNDEAMLAMIDIMEELAIINKNEKGEYELSSTASSRIIFQYGDVLTIRKWYSLRFFILRKMTHIGREEYVSMILTAYDRFIKIHDYLHENIHRVQVIYKLYYGGFIQAFQALLKAKRIKMDPTKGAWKEHKALLRKIYHAVERVRIEAFFESEGPDVIGETDNAVNCIWGLQSKFNEFCNSLEHSPCQISRMCALFMKITKTWLLCDTAVSPGDWALLEVFGCDWIDIWASVGKYQYTLETKRRIEVLYRLLSWPELEFHRNGRFVRTKDGRDNITYDHMCENHNMFEKRLAPLLDFQEVVARSTHIHAGQRAQEEIFPNAYRKRKGNSMAPDINLIYTVLKEAGVFQTPNIASKVRDNTFWKHVVDVEQTETPALKSKHQSRVAVPLTPAERTSLEILWDKSEINPCSGATSYSDQDNANIAPNQTEEFTSAYVENDNDFVSASSIDEDSVRSDRNNSYTNDANSIISEVSSIDEDINDAVKDTGDMLLMLDAVDENINSAKNDIDDREIYKQSKEIVYGQQTPSRGEVFTPSSQAAATPCTPISDKAVKKLGNLTKYKLNHDCLVDHFVKGRKKNKNIENERKAELAVLERKSRLIWLSVEYFKEKRANENADLKANLESRQTNQHTNNDEDYDEWERAMEKEMSEFDYDNYITNI